MERGLTTDTRKNHLVQISNTDFTDYKLALGAREA